MSTESTGTSSFDDDNVGSTSPSPPKKIKSEEEEEDADDTDIDAVLAAESDCSDSELNDKIVVRDKLKKGDVAWRLQISSMRTNRHVNHRNVKEDDFTRTEEDFQEKCEILNGKMYVVKSPKVEKTKAALMPVFNKSDFSERK